MKRILYTVLTGALLLAASVVSRAQGDTVYVSRLYTTHLVFPTEIKYGDLSNTDQIAASIVEYSKNLLSLIALEPFSTPANVTVLESNGSIHTYILAYQEHPAQLVIDTRKMRRDAAPSHSASSAQAAASAPSAKPAAPAASGSAKAQPKPAKKDGKPRHERGTTPYSESGNYVNELWKQDAPPLQSVIGYPQGLWHLTNKRGRVHVSCENIFSYSDITYIILSLHNRSGVSFEVSDATFRIEPKSRAKRKLVTGKNLVPQNKVGTLTAGPKQKSRVAYALDKTTLSPDQVLVIRIFERGGQRNLELTLSANDINLATPPVK